MQYLDPLFIIKTLGLFGVVCIIFAESGLFFGFFLPGDSLLFTAGLLAGQGYMNIAGLFIGVCIAAVVGDTVGYHFGRHVGPRLFNKEDSLFFHKKHLERARVFVEKYGTKAIVLARFLPIVRTFAPIVAGVGGMEYKKFIVWNIVGGFLWSALMIWSGYFLGTVIPGIESYILPIVLCIIFLSFIPPAIEVYKSHKS
jgi:membrane-associated protein